MTRSYGYRRTYRKTLWYGPEEITIDQNNIRTPLPPHVTPPAESAALGAMPSSALPETAHSNTRTDEQDVPGFSSAAQYNVVTIEENPQYQLQSSIRGALPPSFYEDEDETHILEYTSELTSRGYHLGRFPGITGATTYVVWASLLTSGARKFTRELYESVREVLRTIVPEKVVVGGVSVVPHHRTITRTILPRILHSLAVQCVTLMAEACQYASLIDDTTTMQHETDRKPIQNVPPMEYAIADLGTPPFWEQVVHTGSVQSIEVYDCRGWADDNPAIKAPHWLCGDSTSFEVDSTDHFLPSAYAEACDTVIIQTLRPTPAETLGHFTNKNKPNELVGIVAVGFEIEHSRDATPRTPRTSIHNTDERSSILMNTFQSLDYKWTSSEASRLQHPYMQPSDYVAILRPAD